MPAFRARHLLSLAILSGASLARGAPAESLIDVARARGIPPGESGPRSAAALEVTEPARGDGALRLAARRPGVWVRVSLEGGPRVEGRRAGGDTVYEGASGASVLLRRTADGAEDYVRLPSRPEAGDGLTYRVELGPGARGLRQIGGRLEVLDEKGVPRIRMDPPYLFDAGGTRRPVEVEVAGCAVDRSPAAPWRRPLVEAGASACELRLRWSGASYPVLVDPAWRSTAGAMAFAREYHSAALLENGDVLIAGGHDGAQTELYKVPAEGDYEDTGAFAVTGDMTLDGVERGALAALPGGRALYHGGRFQNGFQLYDSEIYDSAAGTWKDGPSSSINPIEHTLLPLGDGRLMVAGGDVAPSLTGDACIYDPGQGPEGAWFDVAPMQTPRKSHAAAYVNGYVVVAGGETYGDKLLNSSEIYSVATNTWSPGPAMPFARKELTGTALLDGRVLLAGGMVGRLLDGTPISVKNVMAIDPVTKTITALPDMNTLRTAHRAARVADGRVMFSAGEGFLPFLPDAELYDPQAKDGITTTLFTVTPRTRHALTWVGGMRALVVGGNSNYVPISQAEFFYLRPQGAPCQDDQSCLSRHCADEVCCAEACQGECEACSAAVRGTPEPDGVCAARKADAAPRVVAQPACVDESATDKCGFNGRCNGAARDGAAACQMQPPGQLCTDQVCGEPAFAFSVCDGKGACLLTQCAPYARCESTSVCSTSCLISADCVEGHYCDEQSACKPKLGAGSACASAEACQSGHCTDGVCCDSACEGLCKACSAALKGGGADGVCENILGGVDSPGDCPQEEPATCGRTGTCNGNGVCSLHASSTACAADACQVQASGVAAIFAYRCTDGGCNPQQVKSCGLATCGAGDCVNTCAGEQDCASGAYCDEGVCKVKKANGEACEGDAACASKVCADGVCCNTACEGQCESCNQKGREGECVAVKGAPPAGRVPCPAAAGDDACDARVCDGAERAECKGYVADEVACAKPACKPGSATLLLEASCSGTGQCRPQQERSCAPYICADDACKTSCAADSDCTAGTRCEGGLCVASTYCEDTSSLRQLDSTIASCAPYRCDPGSRSCLRRCSSTADCLTGTACTSDGRCEAPLDAPADGGCSTSRPAPAGASWLLLAALLPLLRRRRAWAALLASLPLGCSDAPDTPPAPAREGLAPQHADLSALRGELAAFGEAPGPWEAPAAPSWLRLPARADAPLELREPASGLEIAARLDGALAAPAAHDRGVVAYRDALPDRATLLHRPSAQGTEDFILAPRGSALRSLSYTVELGRGVAGLRLVADTLEFLDRGGAPRLRMATPYAIAEGGERLPVELSVEGCAVDTSPAAPWRRPTTAPGSSWCRVRLSWKPRAGATLIDPAWQLTGQLNQPRALHTADRLPGGLVLVAGGGATLDDKGVPTSEVYDPATGTWAVTGNLNFAHANHGSWVLSDGRVLVAGGRAAESSNKSIDRSEVSEVYNPTTGTWTRVGDLDPPRYTQANSYMPDGRPFLCGGYTPQPDTFYDDAFVFDEQTMSWLDLPGHMIEQRRYHAAFPLPDGRILVASGKIANASNQEVISTSSEFYNPTTGVWTVGPSMKRGRQYATTVPTPSGILFMGGINTGFPPVHNSYEIFSYASSTFTELGTMKKGRVLATATWLAQEGRALVTGGADAISTHNSSELLSPEGLPSLDAGTMNTDRGAHTATLLDSGVVLVAGGGKASLGQLGSPTTSTELFTTQQIGSPCQSDGQCPQADPANPGSRYCVDGVCCNAPCQGTCQACSAAKKGQGNDGQCGSVAYGSDPDNECPVDPLNSCGRTGICDGSGACEFYKEGTSCVQSCEAGQVTSGQCEQQSCKITTAPCVLYTCDPLTSACRTRCTSPDHCDVSAYCDPLAEACTPKRAQGASCSSNAACQSNFCVDGFCCNSECSAPCLTCAAASQQDPAAAGDGVCGPVKADAVPVHGKCDEQVCTSHTYCDGLGSCAAYQELERCSSAQCVGDTSFGYGVLDFACKKGVCTATSETPVSCEAFSCRDGKCLESCKGPEDCSPRSYCDSDGKCQERLPQGAICTDSAQCGSGFCVDGVCCNAPCEGPCGTCVAEDQFGSCAPVKGKPIEGRGSCPATPADQPCQESFCDGVAIDRCAGFVGASTSCRKPSCQTDPTTRLGRETFAATCDGQGECGELIERGCFPYACGAEACLTSCSTDAQCAPGTSCVSGSCVALLTCNPERGVLIDLTGAIAKECGLYRCSTLENTCFSACQSTADCRQGATCSSKGVCEVPGRFEEADAGCGCRVAPRPSPASPASLLLLALLALRRRNRP